MDLFFYQSSNGEWDVDFITNQPDMPAILNDYIKEAVEAAIAKFNKI